MCPNADSELYVPNLNRQRTNIQRDSKIKTVNNIQMSSIQKNILKDKLPENYLKKLPHSV